MMSVSDVKHEMGKGVKGQEGKGAKGQKAGEPDRSSEYLFASLTNDFVLRFLSGFLVV